MQELYLVKVLNKSQRGWVEVIFENGKKSPLPFGTSFGMIRENNWAILDGYNVGFSIKKSAFSNLSTFLVDKSPIKNRNLSVVFDTKENILKINKKKYNLVK